MRDREKLPNLPMELIGEILAWLPVKPLRRSRCVIKSWNSLISEPEFVKLHSNKAIEHEHVLLQRQRIIATSSDGNLYTFDLDEFLSHIDLDNIGVGELVTESELDDMLDDLREGESNTQSELDDQLDDLNDNPSEGELVTQSELDDFGDGDSVHTDSELDDPLLDNLSEGELVTQSELDDLNHGDSVHADSGLNEMQQSLPFYCNGLVLFLSNHGEFKLFNPPTRESKVIPTPPSRFLRQNVNHCKLYGFGFDPSAIDYKMVYGEFYRYELWFSIYSLKSGPWRTSHLGYDYGSLKSDGKGTLLNGGIHWLVQSTNNDAPSTVLLSFLVAEERVQNIPLPPDFNFEAHNDYYLTVFRECLCVAVKKGEEYWIMNEYGVRESWTRRIMSVPSSEWLHLGFRKNNHDLLFFKDQQRLVLYNFNDDSFCILPFCEILRVGFAAIFVESIFPPIAIAALIEKSRM
ncbi:hypothetical protein M0R45_017567 [Rubus argutus]|uniref:F-box domain-containing protein n=1 Tax=Rubus argutus TaxID=59490 RepID=A0AAW1XYG3_RUBAR